MRMNIISVFIVALSVFASSCDKSQSEYDPQHADAGAEVVTAFPTLVDALNPVDTPKIDLSQWRMTWNDEFDYPDSMLEKDWLS